MYHDYVHVEMKIDNQTNIWICSQRDLQRKLISKHLILFHNDRNERLERKMRKKNYIKLKELIVNRIF